MKLINLSGLFFVGLLCLSSVLYAQDSACFNQADIPEDLAQYAGGLLLLVQSEPQYRFLSNSHDLEKDAITSFFTQIENDPQQEVLIQNQVVSPNGERLLIDAYSSDEDARFGTVIEAGTGHKFTISTEMLTGIDVKFMGWAGSDTVVIEHETAPMANFQLEIVNINTGSQVSVAVELENGYAFYRGGVLSSDARFLAVATIGTGAHHKLVDQINLYDINSGKHINTFFTDQMDSIYYLRWSPIRNELIVAAQSVDNTIRVLSLHDEEFDTIANLDVSWGHNIQWSPNGQFLLYRDGPYGTDAPVKVFVIQESTLVSPCVTGDAYWSPDSQYIAIFAKSDESSSEQSKIYLFEVKTGKLYIIKDPSVDLDNAIRIIGWLNLPVSSSKND